MSNNIATVRFYYRLRQQYYKYRITISVWGVAHMLRQVALINKHVFDQIVISVFGVFAVSVLNTIIFLSVHYNFHFKVSSLFLSCSHVSVFVLIKAQAQLKMIVAVYSR